MELQRVKHDWVTFPFTFNALLELKTLEYVWCIHNDRAKHLFLEITSENTTHSALATHTFSPHPIRSHCLSQFSSHLSPTKPYPLEKKKKKKKRLKAILRPWNNKENCSNHEHADCDEHGRLFFSSYFHNNICEDHVILDLLIGIPHSIWTVT